jgi:hypothetical protein
MSKTVNDVGYQQWTEATIGEGSIESCCKNQYSVRLICQSRGEPTKGLIPGANDAVNGISNVMEDAFVRIAKRPMLSVFMWKATRRLWCL